MTMRTYATAADYNNVAEEPVTDERMLLKRLRFASIEVDSLTRRSRYDVDVDGYPTGLSVSEAFTAATCAIAEYWTGTDDPMGVDIHAGAVKIGSVSLGTTSATQDGLSAREKLERRIGTRAIDILTNAGLIQAAVAHL